MATTADVWAPWADFEQVIVDKAIDQWKTTPALCEGQRRTL